MYITAPLCEMATYVEPWSPHVDEQKTRWRHCLQSVVPSLIWHCWLGNQRHRTPNVLLWTTDRRKLRETGWPRLRNWVTYIEKLGDLDWETGWPRLRWRTAIETETDRLCCFNECSSVTEIGTTSYAHALHIATLNIIWHEAITVLLTETTQKTRNWINTLKEVSQLVGV